MRAAHVVRIAAEATAPEQVSAERPEAALEHAAALRHEAEVLEKWDGYHTAETVRVLRAAAGYLAALAAPSVADENAALRERNAELAKMLDGYIMAEMDRAVERAAPSVAPPQPDADPIAEAWERHEAGECGGCDFCGPTAAQARWADAAFEVAVKRQTLDELSDEVVRRVNEDCRRPINERGSADSIIRHWVRRALAQVAAAPLQEPVAPPLDPTEPDGGAEKDYICRVLLAIAANGYMTDEERAVCRLAVQRLAAPLAQSTEPCKYGYAGGVVSDWCSTHQRHCAAAPSQSQPAAQEPEPREPCEECEECADLGYTVGPICCGNRVNGECRGGCAVPEQLPCGTCRATAPEGDAP